MLKVAVAGAPGRMGKLLAEAVLDHPGAVLSGCSARPGHGWAGRRLGELLGRPDCGAVVSDDPSEAFRGAGAIIDFTSPGALDRHASLAAEAGAALVVGTTGLGEEGMERARRAGEQIPVVCSGNMSLGVNLLARLVEKAAAALGEEFDVEIAEAHHRGKADAPSGTALMLGQAAAAGRGIDLGAMSDRGRDGITGARVPGRIGFSSVRGGDIVGEHDVMLAGPGERVILRHVATDRRLFAGGALKAAFWARGKPPGLYSMMDVLGL